jgi:hypothetical protein
MKQPLHIFILKGAIVFFTIALIAHGITIYLTQKP